jgi:hypothetical protein
MGYTNVILSQPPKGNFLKLKEMIGHRVVFLGTHSIEDQPDTMNPGKTRKVASVDMVDLDDGLGGRIQWGALVDKVGIVNKLVGQTTAIMGRIILGEAKVGQSAPFILDDHQPEDAAYFLNVWQPANKDALAGKAAQTTQAPPPPPVAQPQYQQPQVAQQMPAHQWPQGAQPAAQPQYQQMPQQQPVPQYQQAPISAPQPVAAAHETLGNGSAQQFTPEAIAAMQAMIDRGELQAPAQ